jgi:hypothetical protein
LILRVEWKSRLKLSRVVKQFKLKGIKMLDGENQDCTLGCKSQALLGN